jgi:uncharacterized protein (DUF1330 family)
MEENEMSVYMVIEARVKDHKKYDQYITALSEILPNHGGSYLARGGRVTPLFKGMQLERRQPQQLIIVEFPSAVHVRRCFASPECQAIVPLAKASGDIRAVVLEGYASEKQ